MPGDALLGVIGAFVGGWLLPRSGIYLGLDIMSVVPGATLGAVVPTTWFRWCTLPRSRNTPPGARV